MSQFLSRLELARSPSNDALRNLIDPQNLERAMDAHHRLVWSAFAGDPEAKRDFLWRAEATGRFIVLSERRPAKAPLFEEPDVKPFAPLLSSGDKLAFVLRVNATKTRPEKYLEEKNGRKIDRRVDLVMHSLFKIEKGKDRRERRMHIANSVANEWLAVQGTKYGFTLLHCAVADYSVVALPSRDGTWMKQRQFGVMDLSGTLEVTDPTAFLNKLHKGFGRAKAFGCGLMLIRRA